MNEDILKQIKSFFKKHIKVIYNILKLINEACDFFEQRYSIFINRMFFYIENNMPTQALTN